MALAPDRRVGNMRAMTIRTPHRAHIQQMIGERAIVSSDKAHSVMFIAGCHKE